MNIVMLTNTYLPHVGGVARSVAAFSEEYRKRGHRVLVVAPEFPEKIKGEQDVIRIHALQNFNGSDFSVALPFSGHLRERLEAFRPDIVHAHHPFLLGMTALRISRAWELPLVFTHHTLYERYTHYVPADSQALKRFVIELATRYANLASLVFAPSASIAALLRRRGVKTAIAEVPTGVQRQHFIAGNGNKAREKYQIPQSAFVLGHLGRLAPEKNLTFLSAVVAEFMQNNPHVHFLLVGDGPMAKEIKDLFASRGLSARLHMPGTLQGALQSDAYAAMDGFIFTSTSETQGMVLSEAMASGVPVIALDANGTREVVRDGINGRLLSRENRGDFIAALQWLCEQTPQQRHKLKQEALRTAENFSMENCATRALALYEPLLKHNWPLDDSLYAQWHRLRNLIGAQWEILEGVTGAAGAAFQHTPPRWP
ncbi:glycosyltransferase [Microbulbifer thermotolerans]|uniref:glycosyltransferase n=1 Tax=Microbulbifer thermotolerans TaxID=252514 RepID=UPI00224AABA4|nr:glycosyltransferase [Microbulbifer thermotolerans]MCX2782458.1 glycosyltransferase [Microbulbifer thermotolerans]